MLKRIRNLLFALGGFALLAILLYQTPFVKSRVDWRAEKFFLYVENAVNPPGPAPTALPYTLPPTFAAPPPTPTFTPAPQFEPSVTPTATLPPPPPQAAIRSPKFEKQTPNNCGPATLSMMLSLYGWQGSQKDISDLIKPVVGDRNVNPEELRYYVRTQAGWLNLEYRVGGDLKTLKRLIAANYPVMVESVTALDPNDALGPNDDLWAAHYLLLTAYDDAAGTFTVQDSYHGADLKIPYEQLQAEWRPFNNLYLVVYFPQYEEEMKTLLGANWDPDANRLNALESSRRETESQPEDSFAWFNLGANLTYFERYEEAALAFDKARALGLPLRMFRYQFTPFLAYFHANRNEDLLALAEYALKVTEKSEEAWLWYGYGLYRKGDNEGARKAWLRALEINPNFFEGQAQNALKLLP